MKAVLLVGGQGTRLRPLTYRIPKPLVPVMGKPLIRHVIDSLPKEVDEIIVPVSYKRQAMQEYIDSCDLGRGVVLVDEPEPLGTGGAVKNVREHLSDTFLVVNGDTISSLDLEEFVSFHRKKGGVATISLREVEDPEPFGIVELDPDGRILRFQEKPKRDEAFSNLANAGAYALEPEVLEHIGDGFVSMERDVFPEILDKGMFGMRFGGVWMDCGTRENLLDAYWGLMGPETRILSRSSVRGGSDIKPPVVVMDECVIAGTTIGPNAYVSERAVIGLRSTVERSVILEDARIGTACLIRDSIIDVGVSVPDGTKVVAEIRSRADRE